MTIGFFNNQLSVVPGCGQFYFSSFASRRTLRSRTRGAEDGDPLHGRFGDSSRAHVRLCGSEGGLLTFSSVFERHEVEFRVSFVVVAIAVVEVQLAGSLLRRIESDDEGDRIVSHLCGRSAESQLSWDDGAASLEDGDLLKWGLDRHIRIRRVFRVIGGEIVPEVCKGSLLREVNGGRGLSLLGNRCNQEISTE